MPTKVEIAVPSVAKIIGNKLRVVDILLRAEADIHRAAGRNHARRRMTHRQPDAQTESDRQHKNQIFP